MKTTNDNQKNTLRECKKCGRTLAASEFYLRNRRYPDTYCKECRREKSRKTYCKREYANIGGGNRLIITEVKDPQLRMALILNALRMVRRSVLRKRRKTWDMDGENS